MPPFDGLGLVLTTSRDIMTDERSCRLRLEGSEIELVIMGGRELVLRPADRRGIVFSPDGEHLIRSGREEPLPLECDAGKNTLRLSEAAGASRVIKALVSAEGVWVRCFVEPHKEKVERIFRSDHLAHVYSIAVARCGWADLGVVPTLPDAELGVLELGGEPRSIIVRGNPDLSGWLPGELRGDGCHLMVENERCLSIMDGRLACSVSPLFDDTRIVVRDSDGVELANELVPSPMKESETWQPAVRIIQAACSAEPYGTIEIWRIGRPWSRAMLHGFAELWERLEEECTPPERGDM